MKVKICGLRSRAEVTAAAEAGANAIGIVFFPASPRHVSLANARWLLEAVPRRVARVALSVNASDDDLAAITGALSVDMLQLHGRETPERVAEVRERFGLPVMKALGIATAEDLALADVYAEVADQLLLDARPASAQEQPGGNGRAFDWRLLEGRSWSKPWMLAGGLTPDNVAEAIRLTGAEQIDVSSGVEYSPGYKDPDLITAFVRAARGPLATATAR